MRTQVVVFVLSILTGLAGLVGGASITAAQVDGGSVLVRFSAPSTAVLHEPVIVQLMVENRSKSPVQLDLGRAAKGNLRLQITHPDGRFAILAPVVPDEGGVARLNRVSVAAGSAFVRQYVLDEWLALDQVGTYRLSMDVSSLFQAAALGGRLPLSPPSVSLTVRPKNDFELAKSFDRLAQTALAGATAEERLNAAMALSYARDPVAVPSLARVVRASTLYDVYVAGALARIGTEPARSTLQEMAASAATERSRIGNSYLSKLR